MCNSWLLHILKRPHGRRPGNRPIRFQQAWIMLALKQGLHRGRAIGGMPAFFPLPRDHTHGKN
jgi:hypothetical protein